MQPDVPSARLVGKTMKGHQARNAMRLFVTSVVLAALADGAIILVNHGDALLRADLSWSLWVQAALGFIVLLAASAYTLSKLGRRSG